MGKVEGATGAARVGEAKVEERVEEAKVEARKAVKKARAEKQRAAVAEKARIGAARVPRRSHPRHPARSLPRPSRPSQASSVTDASRVRVQLRAMGVWRVAESMVDDGSSGKAHEKGLFHFSRLSARGVAALKKRCRRERERKRQPRGRTRGNDCFKRTRSSEHFNDSTRDTRAAPTPVVAASRPPPRDPPRPSREAASHPNQPLTQPPRT